jgi:hypothetical protein
MAGPTIVTVHHLEHALLAAELGHASRCELRLLSPPAAALYLGPGWIDAIERAVEARLALRVAGILDCADRPDLVQAAFRQGTRAVVFHGRARVAAKLIDIAAAYGASLLRRRPPALDLGAESDPRAALRRHLAAD